MMDQTAVATERPTVERLFDELKRAILDEIDQRAAHHAAVIDDVDPERLIDIDVIARRLDVHKNTVLAMIRENAFPRPIEIGKLRKWRNGDVDDWITARRAASKAIEATAKKAALRTKKARRV